MSASPEQIQYELEHPNQTIRWPLTVTKAIAIPMVFIVVALRFYARWKTHITFGSDDVFIILSVLAFLAYTIDWFLEESFGEGKHFIYVTHKKAFISTEIAAKVAYAVANTLIKFSVLLFYCRVFGSKSMIVTSRILMVLISAYNLAFILLTCFQCIPLSVLWTGGPGKCINNIPPNLLLGVIDLLTDIIILSLPIRSILPLQMTLPRKIQIMSIFLTGVIVCAFSITRVVYLANASPGDPSYNVVWLGVFSYCEIFVGIIAACLPMLGMYCTKAYARHVAKRARHFITPTSMYYTMPTTTTRVGQPMQGEPSEEKTLQPQSASDESGPSIENQSTGVEGYDTNSRRDPPPEVFTAP